MKLFISYRRADSQHITDRIHDHMVNHFGYDNVFQDVDTIPLGVDFRQYLADAVENCDAVLVVIGPDWARIMREREREAVDFVRIEVESALRLGKLVIPVLVMNAIMPAPDDLPRTVQELCYRNAARVRPNPDFKRDCTVIAENITRVLTNANTQNTVNDKEQPTPSLPESKPITKPPREEQKHNEPTIPPERKEQVITPAKKLKSRVLDILPPPFEWCEIPAGEVTLKEGGYVPKGGKTYHVERFWMAKYPVTNAQFAKFIDAGGYQHEEWWTKTGWQKKTKEEWTAPRFWYDKKWNGADYPVVAVTWYEAIAFCTWMSAVTGEDILLPTEQQWQRAAQGDDGRIYPWGDIWESAKCNTDESAVGKTTPVAQYPDGASPYGVMDMSGNVWEWCLSVYEDIRGDLESNNNRVLRGGSFLNSQRSTAASYRYQFGPNSHSSLFGLRVVLSAL